MSHHKNVKNVLCWLNIFESVNTSLAIGKVKNVICVYQENIDIDPIKKIKATFRAKMLNSNIYQIKIKRVLLENCKENGT